MLRYMFEYLTLYLTTFHAHDSRVLITLLLLLFLTVYTFKLSLQDTNQLF